MPKNNNKIFIISGPSGVGKTTIAKGILKLLPYLKTTTTFTTRTKRLGKKEDKIIIHVDKKEFKNKIDNNEFIEWAKVHDNLYGTDKKVLEEQLAKNSLLMNIDVQGALQIKEKLPKKTVLIFLKTKTIGEMIRRIIMREKMPKAILNIRLKSAQKELSLAKKYDYIIINEKNRIKNTIYKVVEIIKRSSKA